MDKQSNFTWGALSSEEVLSSRRTRTLGLAATVRHYNDRAVPGLGGLFYAMPLIWALLGIALCEDEEVRTSRKDIRPLPTANAVEALVMWLGLRGGADMSRGAGQRKLANRDDASFVALRRPGAYVTQPLRMRTVQPLIDLGFVRAPGQRFNHYRLDEPGIEIVESYTREIRDLKRWVCGERDIPGSMSAILPQCQPVPSVRDIIERQLFLHGAGQGRRRALSTLGKARARKLAAMTSCPSALTVDHFADIRGGVAFINLRDAALAVLDKIELHLRSQPGNSAEIGNCTPAAASELANLREVASLMLSLEDSSEGAAAHRFAKACLKGDPDVIRDLAASDGTVVILQGSNRIRAGHIPPPDRSIGTSEDNDAAEPTAFVPQLPRIANFYRLLEDLDLAG